MQIPVTLVPPSLIPLPEHKHDRYFDVRLRVQGQKVTISLDQEPQIRLDLDEILRQNPKLRQAHVQWQAHVGLWDGIGFFRNPSMMVLPRP